MGIDLDQVLFADRYELRQRQSLGRIRNIASALGWLIFTSFSIPKKCRVKHLFLRCLIRDDYKAFFREVVETVPEADRSVVEDYIVKGNKPSIKGLILALMLFTKYFKFKADGPYERLYLYLRLCFYYRQVYALSKVNFRNLILFADMQPVENLASQYFGGKNINTITLQHGLYVEYKNYPTVNVINYLHQPSQYFLSWGDETKELIRKYHPDRKVVVCGKPIYSFNEVMQGHHQADCKYITLIMDQNIFTEYNEKMLLILSEWSKRHNYIINVKFHPYNKQLHYKRLNLDYKTGYDIKRSEFIVGHTSSMLYELLCLNIPIYRFKSSIPCVDFPKELSFESCDELEALQKIRVDFERLGRRYVKYGGNKSRKKYIEFFSAL